MSTLAPGLVFEKFVIGAGNTVAAMAARRAAESPGRQYNPFVISAPRGCGKTHLLHAIGNLAREIDPGLVVRLESPDEIADRVSASLAAGSTESLREFEAAGIWLIDDFQEIAGRERTQRELRAVIDAAVAAGWQIVVATAIPLADVDELDAPLAERLSRGLTVEIAPPDARLRADLARAAASELGHVLTPAVVDAVASLPLESSDAVLRAVQRISAALEIEGREIEPDDVPSLLGVEPVAEPRDDDEFSGFFTDVSNAVAAVVETSPWRRRLAEAILRWGGEGVRTRRLESALEADTAPDVDALLADFEKDVHRLRELRGAVREQLPDPSLLSDPDRLPELEAVVSLPPTASRSAVPAPRTAGTGDALDRWFLDQTRFAWSWVSIDERVIEEAG